LRWPTGRKG
jgi:glyoxylase-like metal-dependent hydrolase (beta-lactamase superfamily II)